MSAAPDAHVEPHAGATAAAVRRFLSLTGLFLAGPVIWITHFFAVYLLAEALCHAGVEAGLLGLHAVSALTLAATAGALAAIAVTTRRAYRRWRDAAIGWGPSASGSHRQGPGGAGEHDAELALAGFLLGALFALAIVFVGLPAVVLAC